MVVWMLITKLTLEPFDYVRKKIERCYHDSRMATPVQSSNGFLVPYPPKKCTKSNGVSFSSDGMYLNFFLQAYFVFVCLFFWIHARVGILSHPGIWRFIKDDRNSKYTVYYYVILTGILLCVQYFSNNFTNRYHWQLMYWYIEWGFFFSFFFWGGWGLC